MKNDYQEINILAYDNVALELENRHKYLRVNEPTPKDYYDKIIKYLNAHDKLNYLELGPGDGNVIKYFSNMNMNTYAIESSSNMTKICKRNAPNSTIINENILNVDIDDILFDIIFAGSFIHLFPKDDLDIIMKKIYSWLNKDGIFFAYTTLHQVDEEGYFSKDKSNYKDENIRFRHRFTSESLKELMLNYKFKILEHYEIEEPENSRTWQFIMVKK